VLVALGPPDPPKAIRIDGGSVRNLNPDERSTVALLSRALEEPLPVGGRWVETLPGIHVSRRDLQGVLEDEGGHALVLLDEDGGVDGPDLPSRVGDVEGLAFVLGDSTGLTEEQLALVRSKAPMEVKLGPLSLHADHCIAIVNNILDRAGDPG
jgi:tRNA (pseudouridine54-N1)-methyltransferase